MKLDDSKIDRGSIYNVTGEHGPEPGAGLQPTPNQGGIIQRDSKDDYLIKNDSTITIKVAINKTQGGDSKDNETHEDAISEHKSENV